MADETPSAAGAEPAWDAVMPLMAHGMLTPISVIRGYAELLMRSESTIDPEKRKLYLARIIENADFISETLTDMARGLPPAAWRMLDELNEEGMKRYLSIDSP